MLTKLNSSLIILCLILFSQCQTFEQEVTPREQRGYISVNEDAYMESFRSSLSEDNSRTQESDINWNEIYRVYDPEHDLTTYTLYKRSNTPNTFDNLVVLKKQDQENTYTIRYKPNPAWLKGKRLLNHLESFTGRVEFLSSDGEMISGLNYVNGVSELEKKKATGRLQDCETVYEIHWTESCAEGGDCVGGENITIYEWQICDLPGPSEPDGDEIIDGGPSTGGGGTGIGGGNPGLNDNDDIEECPLGGVLDSNGNCIVNQLEDDCLRNTADKVLSPELENIFNDVIQEIFNSNEEVNLILRDDGTPRSLNDLGWTELREKNGIIDLTIFLNADRFSSSSQEFVAATIYHEAFHAIVLYLDKDNWFKYSPDDHHTALFSSYLGLLSNSMQSVFPSLSSNEATGLILKGMLSYKNTWGDIYDEILSEKNYSEEELANIGYDHYLGKIGTPCN